VGYEGFLDCKPLLIFKMMFEIQKSRPIFVPAAAVRRMGQAFMCISRCKRWEGGPICQNKKSKKSFGFCFATLGLELNQEKWNVSRRDKI
jgi:hypothetical protein